MPAMYAHYVFGRETLPLFNAEIQQIIKAHRNMFDLGLQGPDFYFFDQLKYLKGKTFARIGRELHHEPCEQLLAHFERENGRYVDISTLAYVLGLIGHFSLDSTCHPYIDAWVEAMPYNHMRMETEFDRFLLERDGKKARRFPLGQCMASDKQQRMAIGYLYEGHGSAKEVASLLREYGIIKNAMRTPIDLQYLIYQVILGVVGARKFIGGVFMGPQDAKSYITNPRLCVLFNKAKHLFVRLTDNYMEHYLHGNSLDAYFKRDFEVLPEGEQRVPLKM